MSVYNRYARSSWATCTICGEDFPQVEMTRHFRYKVLVDDKCADELSHSDYMEALRLPDLERPFPTQQQVPDQGKKTPDPPFTLNAGQLDKDPLELSPGPRTGQPPQ